MTSASVLASVSPNGKVRPINQTSSLLPKLLLVMVFITAIRSYLRTILASNSRHLLMKSSWLTVATNRDYLSLIFLFQQTELEA